MSDRQTIAAAAGALAASLGAAAAADGAIVYTESNLAGPGQAMQFVAVEEGDIHRPPRVLGITALAAVPPGPSEQSIDVIPAPGAFNRYAMFGVSPSGGVFVTSSDQGAVLGLNFEEVFPGFQEAAVADAILNGGPLLDAFASAVAQDPRLTSANWIEVQVTHFSQGSPYGTFFASDQPIPTPGALALLAGSGAFGLARRRRRRA